MMFIYSISLLTISTSLVTAQFGGVPVNFGEWGGLQQQAGTSQQADGPGDSVPTSQQGVPNFQQAGTISYTPLGAPGVDSPEGASQTGGFPTGVNFQGGFPPGANTQSAGDSETLPQATAVQGGFPQMNNFQRPNVQGAGDSEGGSVPSSNFQAGYPPQNNFMGGYPEGGNFLGGFPQGGFPQGGNLMGGGLLGGFPQRGNFMGGFPQAGNTMGGLPLNQQTLNMMRLLAGSDLFSSLGSSRGEPVTGTGAESNPWDTFMLWNFL